MTIMPPQRSLLDSGDLCKLEQFAERRLIRASRFSLWKPRLPQAEWERADATFDHKKGWIFKRKEFSEWMIELGDLRLQLRLQENGQIGFFPEHVSYFPTLKDLLAKISAAKGAPARVLNLFAYTGMATVFCAQQKAHVTHVDISKKVLEWAKINFDANKLPADAVRLIKEDALEFLRREHRRGNLYDLVIADPPSFSRPTGSKSWDLEQVLVEMIELCSRLLNKKDSAIVLTNHHFETGGHVLANLLHDANKDSALTVSTSALTLQERESPREIPAGFLVIGHSFA